VKRIFQRFYPEVLPQYKHYLIHKDFYKEEMKVKVLTIAQKYNLTCKFAF